MMYDSNRGESIKDQFSTKGFPDALDPNKDSEEFGLRVAKAIETEWFRRHKNSNSRYYDNQYKYHRLRYLYWFHYGKCPI